MTKSNFIILGMGGRGKSFVNYCHQHMPRKFPCMLASLDVGGLIFHDLDSRRHLSIAYSDLVTPKPYQAFLVAGLGGSTGGELAPLIDAYFSNQGISCESILCLPSDFEGRERKRKAILQLNDIEKYCKKHSIIRFEVNNELKIDSMAAFNRHCDQQLLLTLYEKLIISNTEVE